MHSINIEIQQEQQTRPHLSDCTKTNLHTKGLISISLGFCFKLLIAFPHCLLLALSRGVSHLSFQCSSIQARSEIIQNSGVKLFRTQVGSLICFFIDPKTSHNNCPKTLYKTFLRSLEKLETMFVSISSTPVP